MKIYKVTVGKSFAFTVPWISEIFYHEGYPSEDILKSDLLSDLSSFEKPFEKPYGEPCRASHYYKKDKNLALRYYHGEEVYRLEILSIEEIILNSGGLEIYLTHSDPAIREFVKRELKSNA